MARLWAVAALIIILAFFSSTLWASDLTTDFVREALALDDGSSVSLPSVFVSDIVFPYAVVTDLYGPGPHPSLAVFLGKFQVGRYNTLNIRGTITTLGQDRVLIAREIEIFTNSEGFPFEHPFPCRALPWDYIVDAQQTQTPAADTSALPAIPIPEPKIIKPISAPSGTVASAKICAPAPTSVQSLSSASALSGTPPQLVGGSVALEQKIVTAVFYVANTQTVDYFYICDADNPIGIKVDPQGSMSVDVTPGDEVSVAGTVIASSSTVPECYVDPTSIIRTSTATILKPLALNQRATAGGVFGLQQALCSDATTTPVVVGSGLNAVGVRARVCGTITYLSNDKTTAIIDDGSGLKSNVDGADRTGIRLIYPADSPTIYNTNDYLAGITGILGAENTSGSAVPVIRCSRINVKLTSPPDGQLHVASNATSVLLAGTASSPGIGITSVKVGFGSTEPTTWYEASYNSTTLAWTYDWPSPASDRIWVRAYDLAGNATQIWRDVTVTSVDVIYVSQNGDDTTGLSWATAKTTVDGGITAASSGNEVWVAKGSYPEQPSIVHGIRLYGGFSDNEFVRESRNWLKNETVIGYGLSTPYDSGSGYVIDGFTISGGFFMGGITLSAGDEISVAHNTLKTCSISISPLVDLQRIRVSDNWLINGSTISCNSFTSNDTVVIANNTIAESTSGGYGTGIYLYDASPTIANNIFSNLYCGIYDENLSSAAFIRNNCTYQAAIPDQLGQSCNSSGNISSDPMLLGVHIHSDSLCRDGGYNSATFTNETDIDEQARIYNSTVDIGADESAGCEFRKVTLSPESVQAIPPATATFTATVLDELTQQPVQGYCVDFSVHNGNITDVVGNPVSPPSATARGTTDANGVLTVTVLATADKTAIVTAKVVTFCTEENKAESMVFGGNFKFGFLYDVCAPFNGYAVSRDSMEDYFTRLDNNYNCITYSRVNNPDQGIDSSFNTVFLNMPSRSLTQAELNALSTFVQSGRNKRVVLMGEYSSDCSPYNLRLNSVADALGMNSRFSASSERVVDGPVSWDNVCSVNNNHYLTPDVSYMWDGLSDYFVAGWETYARPLAYLQTVPDQPWIIEEDTAAAGSRIAIHDVSMLYSAFNDVYDTIPDKNFKFIRNLCTIFPD
ncbi:MAG: hypothetical protein ACYC64_16410 [Armatimonadota bacterium]